MSDFLDANYEIPKGPSNYVKLETGDTKVRILSKPTIGWSYWNTEQKPVRIAGTTEPAVDKSLIHKDKFGNQHVKHFWAMVVYNYNAKQIQVLEITQSSILTSLKDLAENADWGSPFLYDINIKKEGAGKETTYTVTPVPPKPVSEEVKAAFKARPANLQALFTGKDPFEAVPAKIASVAKAKAAPTPATDSLVNSGPNGEDLSNTNFDDSLPF